MVVFLYRKNYSFCRTVEVTEPKKKKRKEEKNRGEQTWRRLTVALTRCWWRQRWQNAAADCGVTVVLLFSLMFFCSFYISSFSRFLSSPLNLCLSLLLFFLLPLPSLILKTLSPQSFPLLCSSLLSIFLLSFSFFLLLSSSSVFFLFGFGFFFLFFHSPISLPVLLRVKICPSVPSVFLLKMSLVF